MRATPHCFEDALVLVIINLSMSHKGNMKGLLMAFSCYLLENFKIKGVVHLLS